MGVRVAVAWRGTVFNFWKGPNLKHLSIFARALPGALAVLLGTCAPRPCLAAEMRMDDEVCVAIREGVASSDYLGRKTLSDSSRALKCLVNILNGEKIVSVDDATNNIELRRVTQAIRAILDAEDRLSDRFREWDTLPALVNLAFSARSLNKDTRVNSTLILGNIADSNSLCVLLDHLYDPAITPDGRFNLLAVLSTLPSKSSKSEVRSIGKLLAYAQNALAGRSDMTETQKMLLSLQDKTDRRSVALAGRDDPPAGGELCYQYTPHWAYDRIEGTVTPSKITVYPKLAYDQEIYRRQLSVLKNVLALPIYSVAPSVYVGDKIGNNEIKFCDPDDFQDADSLKSYLESVKYNKFTVSNLVECDRSAKHHTLEIWLNSP